MIKKYYAYLTVAFLVLLGGEALPDHYYGHYEDQYSEPYGGQRGYSGSKRSYGNEGYGYYPGTNYDYSTEGYYACPRGDYVSDRPGQCPLDGLTLVPRGSSHGRRQPQRGPYY